MPKTGQRFETGIDTGKTSMDMTPHFATEFDCPHCGERHLIAKEDFCVCEIVDGVVHYLRAA